MTMMPFRGSKVLLVLLLLTGSLNAQQGAPAKRTVTTPAAIGPNATIQDIMATAVDPTSKIVFEAVSTETVQGKELQKAPKTDAEWAAVKAAALRLVDASKSIAMDGRGMARDMNAKGKEGELSPKEIQTLLAEHRPEWNAFAREFGNVASMAARAAEKKDVDGVFGAAGDLDTACENCHLAFWYPDQEKLFKK